MTEAGSEPTATITIRPARAGDTDAVIALIVPIQSQEFGFAITARDQPDLADIDGFYHVAGGGFWVAEARGRVVGTIALKDLGSGQGALRKMFVASSHRGGGLRVAERLLCALVAHAEEHGIRTILLGTTERFQAAHRFYEKNGFVSIAAGELPEHFPRMTLDNRFYRRSL
jgi:N-acetylglutamate synthase-like GNAT family acetyltransferase